MSDSLPQFRDPPLIETALSLQFSPIPELRSTHLASFWMRHRDAFPITEDAEPIASQKVLFGADILRASGPPRIQLSTPRQSRLQMVSEDLCRMVQVQNGRLVFNWRKFGDGQYPRWKSVKADFDRYWTCFLEFLAESELTQPKANLWEVVYVNHLEKGREWESPKDWSAVVPGLVGDFDRIANGRLDSFSSNTEIELGEQIGRLRIELNHGSKQPSPDTEADRTELLLLQLIARGPVGEAEAPASSGMDMGRAAIVENFASLTGERAHMIWGRTE